MSRSAGRGYASPATSRRPVASRNRQSLVVRGPVPRKRSQFNLKLYPFQFPSQHPSVGRDRLISTRFNLAIEMLFMAGWEHSPHHYINISFNLAIEMLFMAGPP